MAHASDFSIKNWFLREARNIVFERKYKDVFFDEISFYTYEYEDKNVKIFIFVTTESFIDKKQIIDKNKITLENMLKHISPTNKKAIRVNIDWGDGNKIEFYLNKTDWYKLVDNVCH